MWEYPAYRINVLSKIAKMPHFQCHSGSRIWNISNKPGIGIIQSTIQTTSANLKNFRRLDFSSF